MKWITVAVFVVVLLGHFLVVTQFPAAPTEGGSWVAYEFEPPDESRLALYLGAGEYWLGLSYAFAGTFAAFCFVRITQLRRDTLAASVGGLTLSGILWAGVCFLTGCCGSPMLPLYLGIFGSKFISITKPLTFGVTLLSIVVGYAWMLKWAQKEKRKNVNPGIHETVGTDPGKV